MNFKEAYKKVSDLFNSDSWKVGRIVLAGETDNFWIFKSETIKGKEYTPVSVIVDKATGEMRRYSVYDRYDAERARIIDLQRALA